MKYSDSSMPYRALAANRSRILSEVPPIVIVEKEWINKISTLDGTKSDVLVRKVCLTSQDSQLIKDNERVDEVELIGDGEMVHLMQGSNMLRVARGLVTIKLM